jgi:hypothetical protein
MDIRSTGQSPRGFTVSMDHQEDSPLNPFLGWHRINSPDHFYLDLRK